MLWGCVDFALMAESRRVVEHVRLHPVGGCSAQRLTNQPTNLLEQLKRRTAEAQQLTP